MEQYFGQCLKFLFLKNISGGKIYAVPDNRSPCLAQNKDSGYTY